MKRLMIVLIMFLSFLVQADDGAKPSTDSTVTQSPSDAAVKNIDDTSISVANVHHINLDNTQMDGGGNWLNKRIWYERAQTVFDEIRVMVNAVADIRIQFSNEVNGVGHKIDSFFEIVSFKQGELQDKFKEMLVALETEQKIVGDLSVEERNLQATLKQELKVIEQIEKDMKSIGEVDNKIEETFLQALKTIDECREYETKSWETFKSIGKELDDKKARNLYYQMNNYKQNIEQKISYLKATLLPYLHNVLVTKIDTNIAKINAAVDQLKAKGLDLEKIMNKTQEDDVASLKGHDKLSTEVAVRKAVEEETKKAQQASKQFEKSLEEEKQKSFSNVMHQYYAATIGKVVGFVHQGFVGESLDYVGSFFTGFFKNYSYPVITYVHHGIIAAKDSMHKLIVRVMIYFGGKQAVKEVIAEKIAEKIHDATGKPVEQVKETIREKIAEKIQEKIAEEHKDAVVVPAAVSSDVATPSTDTTPAVIPTPAIVDQPANNNTTDTSTAPADAATSTTDATPAASSDNVAVQFIKNDQSDSEQDHRPQTNLYQVFKAMLDFIGTICMSLYRCVTQFFSLLLSFAKYIAA